METPDFDRIAREVLWRGVVMETGQGDGTLINEAFWAEKRQDLAEQLRLIWNARGAADAQAVDNRIRELVAGEVVGAGIARHVTDAIRQVDR